MRRYSVSEHEARIMVERRKVYGDPVENHEFIAQQITGLLSPWVHRIAANKPLPPHVIALILCALKMSRMRRVFHDDNYDDMSVYQKFARTWHREWEKKAEESGDPLDRPIDLGENLYELFRDRILAYMRDQESECVDDGPEQTKADTPAFSVQ